MATGPELTMSDVWTLLLLSLSMLVGCYVSGSIPLVFSFSEEKLKLVTVMGAGLLVGTSLAVIIPEGVHTLYESHLSGNHGHSHEHNKEGTGAASIHHEEHGHAHAHAHESGVELHTYVGVSLVVGFVFMLIVDQLSGGHAHGPSDGEVGVHTGHTSKKSTATLGLVLHAAADGIALGAAATTAQAHIEMIVFVAIMLHKAPAAFGLVTFLLHEGLERNKIRKHLAIFSAAAPVLAILTYFGLSQQSKETLSTVNATSIAMLFSAGTFLYVATVHVLPEIATVVSSRTVMADGSVVIHEHKGFTKLELFLMVIGAMLPLVLALGHHH